MSRIIYNQLIEYKKQNIYPWHMPGHKRNFKTDMGNPYEIDITEIDGFDNLHYPQEIILKSRKETAKIYGTKQSYYLVNGSTVGILSAISAVCRHGDAILMARNCHKSVYHAVKLLELMPYYLECSYNQRLDLLGGISVEHIKQQLQLQKNIKAVIVVSPSYEGCVLDIKCIAEVVHQYGIPLIVDEAHGAHFCFDEKFPKSAISLGADIVIQSLHKTLPSLTQTALLHLCSDRMKQERLEQYLSIYQSSSPSYLFLASIEYCIDYVQSNKKELFQEYNTNLLEFRKKSNMLKHIHLLEYKDMQKYHIKDYDRGKLVFSVKESNMTGKEFYDILLKDYHLQLEMAQSSYVLAMSSIQDTKEGFERLWQAIFEVDRRLKHKKQNVDINLYKAQRRQIFSPSEALEKKYEYYSLKDSIGKISADDIVLYPPGIPALVAGEEITKEILEMIQIYIEQGFDIQGLLQNNTKIKAIKGEAK